MRGRAETIRGASRIWARSMGFKEGRTVLPCGRMPTLQGQCLAAKRVVDLTLAAAIERRPNPLRRARRIRKPPRRMHAI